MGGSVLIKMFLKKEEERKQENVGDRTQGEERTASSGLWGGGGKRVTC